MSSGEPTDRDLVLQIRNGDTVAFDTLVVRYYQPLLNMVARYVDSIDIADDVLQEMFIRLWDRRSSWTIPDSVREYLYSSARNTALNAIRGGQRRKRAEERAIDSAAHDGSYDPYAEIESDEFAAAVWSAVDELPKRGKEVYTLAYQHGLTYQEIARILGVSLPTVKTHMARALVSLQRKLRRFVAVSLLM